MNKKNIIIGIICLSFGILVGGYLFHKSQPRSFLSLNNCQKTCLNANEFTGLIASVGVQISPGIIPNKIIETDKTIAFEHPFPEAKQHYVIIPKVDIKNIEQINNENQDYLIDAYSVIQKIIDQENLKEYRIITNGPGFQHVTYLHFHLRAN